MQEHNTHRILFAIIGVIFTAMVMGAVIYFFTGNPVPWGNPEQQKKGEPIMKKYQDYEDNKRKPMTVLPYKIDFPD